MIFYFRVDASLEIGTGHVMRCLVLAQELKKLGFICEFIVKNHEGSLNKSIADEGFKIHTLLLPQEKKIDMYADGDHSKWLGSDWLYDAKLTLDVISKSQNNILIVDHYGIDDRWECLVKNATTKLVVIDDLANRGHKCDLLIDYGIDRKDNDYAKLVPSFCKLLTGVKYVFMSPAFKKYRQISQKRLNNSDLNSWLIFMGGVDKYNNTSVAIKALEKIFFNKKIKVRVVLGRSSQWIDDIKRLIGNSTLDIELIINTKNMAKLICESDCGIGGAGISSLERAYLGLPTITLVMAENQKSGASALERLGIAKVIPNIKDFNLKLIEEINNIRSNKKLITSMQINCYSLLDGKGLSRVVRALADDA